MAGFDHSALGDQDCAITWQTWKRRIIPSGKRLVFKSTIFCCPSHLQHGLAELESTFTSGENIWPWQSKLIDRPSFEDGLYNDYRVVHFHLGTYFEPSGYINRTRELLFAVVDSTSVYEIGIYRHGDWYEFDILDIINENWPKLLDNVTMNGLDIAPCIRTREEVKAIREANIIPIIKLKNGRIVAPLGGGVATDGTSFESVRSADFWAKVLRTGEKAIIADIREQIRNRYMESRDYEVLLDATNNEIAGVLDGTHKWILWKKT